MQRFLPYEPGGRCMVQMPGHCWRKELHGLCHVPAFGADTSMAHPLIHERLSSQAIQRDTMIGQPGTAPEHECDHCKQQRTRCQAANRGTCLNRLHQSFRTVRCSESRIPALREASNLTIVKRADS